MSNLKNKHFSRRDFLRGASVATAAGVLAACAPAGSTGSASDAGGGDAPSAEAQTVSFWIFWTQPGKIADQLLATSELEELMGGNTLDFKTGVNQEARLTAIAGGTPPDIGALGDYTDFMARGVVDPLDDYVATSSVINEEDFLGTNWSQTQYEGAMYGIPAIEGFVRRALYYNAKMIEEAGLDPDNPPVTWDELFDWHVTLTKFDDAGNLLQIGIDPFDAEGGVGPGNDGWCQMDSWGIQWWNADTKVFNFDNEEFAESYEVMGEFIRHVGPDNLVGMRGVEGQGTWGGAFNAEVQAMIIEGYWHSGETFNEKPEVAEHLRATWIPVPESRRGTKIQTGGGHMVQMFRDGKLKDEAWPVAEWLQTDGFINLIFENIGWLPSYKPFYDTVDPNYFPALEFTINSVEEATYWGEENRNEIMPFIREKHGDYREAVYRDEMSGAEAAAKLQVDAEKEWKAAGFG
ncbi:MAG: substrate-binding domain-containing protein [Chloroflexota bacterium]